TNRGNKRKKFPHVLQVHEELGPREQRTTALENNRARPPPRTPQRKNQTSRLQAESTTEQARRSQHLDTAARQYTIRQLLNLTQKHLIRNQETRNITGSIHTRSRHTREHGA